MQNFLYYYDTWKGLIPIIGGIYLLLLNYKIILPSKDQIKAERWYKKFGKMAKIIGPFCIAFGLSQLLGFV